MPRISLLPLEQRNQGLWISGPREKTPAAYMRRNRGSHLLREHEVRSRNGTTADAAVAAAHSLHKFNSVRFQGATTVLYRNAVSIDTGYDGTPLEFSASPPRTGTVAEYLFVSGGGKLRKVDTSGTVTQWGISPPTTGAWGASVGGAEEAETATTVFDPQEKTIALTNATTNWFAVGSVTSASPFLSTGQENASGFMVTAECRVLADDTSSA